MQEITVFLADSLVVDVITLDLSTYNQHNCFTQAAKMQTGKEHQVYSPLLRRHAATVTNLHHPTVDVSSDGDVRVNIHQPVEQDEEEIELTGRPAGTVTNLHHHTVDVTSDGDIHVSSHITEDEKEERVVKNKRHQGLIRQRSRSEADILGLIEALKLLEEGTLATERPNSASNKDGRTRKISGGIKVNRAFKYDHIEMHCFYYRLHC